MTPRLRSWRLRAAPVLWGACLLASPVWAADKACLLEGKFVLMGKTFETRDCLENAGMPPARFVQNCQGMAEAPASMGAPPAKLSYLGACPAQPQGVCENLLGAPMKAFYYKLDAQGLAATKASCQSQGGKWR